MPNLIRNFTSYGAKRQIGPTQSQAPPEIKIIGQGIQKFIIPFKGMYVVEAVGASGISACPTNIGGKGASLKGTFFFNKGTILYILA